MLKRVLLDPESQQSSTKRASSLARDTPPLAGSVSDGFARFQQESSAQSPKLPTFIARHLAGMNALYGLCWGLDDDPPTREPVFCEEDVVVPNELPVLVSLQEPSDSVNDVPTSVEVIKHQFLNLTAHPGYAAVPTNERMGILPCGVDKLVILPAYKKILERAETLNERYCTSSTLNVVPLIRNMIVTGVPGIGKSCCQDFILVTRLAARKKTVMQPYWLKGQGYLRFDEEGVAFVPANSDNELEENCKNKTIWALLDDYPLAEFGDPRVYDWLFLWTASPRKHKSSTWQKEAKAELQYMDTWKWSEICATRHTDADVIKRLRYSYGRYSGVPRVLLTRLQVDDESGWEENLQIYDREVKSEIRALLSSTMPLKAPEDIYLGNASYKIINLRPEAGNRLAKQCQAEVSTAYLVDLIVHEVLETQHSELRMFYRKLMEVPAMRTAAGRVFEHLVHQYFKRCGNSYSIGRDLGGGDTLGKRTFAISGSEEFHSLKLLGPTLHEKNSSQVLRKRQNIYFHPLAPNLASVDSFMYSSSLNMTLMFQITVGDKHDIKLRGLRDVWECTPAIWQKQARFIFVVPKGCGLNTPQRYTGQGTLTWAWKGNLVQRVVHLGDEELFGDC